MQKMKTTYQIMSFASQVLTSLAYQHEFPYSNSQAGYDKKEATAHSVHRAVHQESAQIELLLLILLPQIDHSSNDQIS